MKPFLSFAVQGGDAQDQNLLQFFLNVVEFGMSVQQAAEAAQHQQLRMHESFGMHTSDPGRLVVRNDTPSWVRAELERMGYRIEHGRRRPVRSTRSTSIELTARFGRLERLRRRLRHSLVARPHAPPPPVSPNCPGVGLWQKSGTDPSS